MFPPLCFVDEQKGIIDKDTDDKLREVLTEEEYELISQKTSKQVDRVQIKFKIVEIIRLHNPIFSKLKITRLSILIIPPYKVPFIAVLE